MPSPQPIYCVLGAGAAGLAAARHLRDAAVPFEVVERERDVGGLWDASLPHSPVYRSAHLISSKPRTEFPDYPMPGDYPDYPSHAQALEYLRSYARAFGLYDFIRFGRPIDQVGEVGLKLRLPLFLRRSLDQLLLMDLQARAVAGYIRAARANWPGLRRVRALKQGPRPDLGGGIRRLRKVIRLLSGPRPPPPLTPTDPPR